VEVGAGTMCPEPSSACSAPQPYRVAYVQPSRRPADGRYGDNPTASTSIPASGDPEALARRHHGAVSGQPRSHRIDLRQHDIKFEEDNWESPTLGAWGIGWQVMLDGLEVTQFTYFQQCAASTWTWSRLSLPMGWSASWPSYR